MKYGPIQTKFPLCISDITFDKNVFKTFCLKMFSIGRLKLHVQKYIFLTLRHKNSSFNVAFVTFQTVTFI